MSRVDLPRTFWLHRDLGPVKMEPGGWELESWTGIVSNEDMTWSDVKSLYR